MPATRAPASPRPPVRAVRPVRPRRRRDPRRRAVAAAGLLFAPPVLLLAAASLRPPGRDPQLTPPLLPDTLSLDSYRQALTTGGLARAMGNSLLVCLAAVPLGVLVAALAGFALTRVGRRAARAVVLLSLTALMVPATAVLIPRFALFKAVHLTDTLAPLVAPALLATSPLYPLVYFVAFRAVPADLYDAARQAGLGPLRTWWEVALPQVRPVTVALAAFTFVVTWSNFLDPLLYLYDRRLFTVPLALRSLATLDPTNTPVFLAGAVLATLPAAAVFAVAQRWMRAPHGTDLPRRSS